MGVPPDEYALPTRSRVGGRAAAGLAAVLPRCTVCCRFCCPRSCKLTPARRHHSPIHVSGSLRPVRGRLRFPPCERLGRFPPRKDLPCCQVFPHLQCLDVFGSFLPQRLNVLVHGLPACGRLHSDASVDLWIDANDDRPVVRLLGLLSCGHAVSEVRVNYVSE